MKATGKHAGWTDHLRQPPLLICEVQHLVGGPAADDEGQDVIWRDHVTWARPSEAESTENGPHPQPCLSHLGFGFGAKRQSQACLVSVGGTGGGGEDGGRGPEHLQESRPHPLTCLPLNLLLIH